MSIDTHRNYHIITKAFQLWFRCWPLSILSYRHALRVLDAATTSVGAISEAIVVLDTDDSKIESLCRIEIEGILDTLKREMPPFASSISRSVSSQWEKIKEVEKTNSVLTARVKALHRVLEAQRRILVASTPVFSPSAIPKTSSLPTPQIPTEAKIIKPDQLEAFKPDESALLAKLTEKFYGSSAFKVIGGSLVAAALLAGGGTVYLGAQTLTLRDDLEKTEVKAKRDINDSA